MYKQVLRAIEGIEIYPLISLTIFFIFFAVLLIFVMKEKKGFVNRMAAMPLDPENEIEFSLETNETEPSK